MRVGLAIGRIVFRALNIAEVIWAVVIAVCLSIAGPSAPVLALAAVTAVLLGVHLLLVPPRLTRRSAHVLAGQRAALTRTPRLHRVGGAQARRACRPWRRPPVGMTILPAAHEEVLT